MQHKTTIVSLFALLTACGGGGGGSSSSGANAGKPRNLRYSVETAVLLRLVETELVPHVNGNVQSWAVTPALPPGLSFDTDTGVISGAPDDLLPPTSFEVTATNSRGSDSVELTVVVSPPPRFAYLANTSDDTISLFTTDSLTGSLQFFGFQELAASLDGPEQVVLHPSGNFAFVPSQGDGINPSELASFAIEPDTGLLTLAGTIAIGVGPHAITMSPGGGFVYVASSGSNTVAGFVVDAVTGLLTPAGPPSQTGANPAAIAMDPLGRFLYVAGTSVSIFSINPATGMLGAPLSHPLNGSRASGVQVSPSGSHLYLTANNFDFIIGWNIDPATGALTNPTSQATGDEPSALAVHPLGEFVYVSDSASDTLSTFTVDPATGELAALGTVTSGSLPVHVTFDASGLFAYVVEEGTSEVVTYTVDVDTGVPTFESRLRSRKTPSYLTVGAGFAPVQLSGEFLFVANRAGDSITGYSLDADTGDLLPVGPFSLPPGAEPVGVATDPQGRWLYSVQMGEDTLRAFSIDGQTGILAPLGSLALTDPSAVTVDPSGVYAFVATAGGTVFSYRITPSTGALSPVDDEPVGANSSAIGVDPTGQYLFVANQGSNNISSFTLNQGVMTSTGSETAPGAPSSIRFSPFGDHLYVALPAANLVVPYAIDPVTGTLTVEATGSQNPGTRPTSILVHPGGHYAYAAVNEPAGMGRVTALSVDPASGALAIEAQYLRGINPREQVVDPGGSFLFVINEGSDDITRFAVDPGTGLLEYLGSTPSGDQPVFAALTATLQ